MFERLPLRKQCLVLGRRSPDDEVAWSREDWRNLAALLELRSIRPLRSASRTRLCSPAPQHPIL